MIRTIATAVAKGRGDKLKCEVVDPGSFASLKFSFLFFVMFYSSFCATYSNIVIVLIIN